MLGNGDLKSIDERGSDGGEGNSPAYNEHNDHHNPFKDGSEELESAAQPRASDFEFLEGVSSDVKIDQVLWGQEDCEVLVEKGLKSEECSERKNVSFELTEIAKELYYENGNGNDTSKGESLTVKNSEGVNCNSVQEAIESHEFRSIDSVSEVKNSDSGSILLEKSVVRPVEVTNLTAMKINEDNVCSLTNENVTTSSMEEPKSKECDSIMLTSLSACPFTKFTNGAEHVKNCETAELSENQPHVALAPNVVQKTSWLSCCGLFEVLSSSTR